MTTISDTIDFEAVASLVGRYKDLKRTGEFRLFKEEQTKNDFIIPLFRALGWNVDNKPYKDSSMSLEEKVSKKRVDLGFRINGIPKFFVEAKSLREENIHSNSNYIEQAINYSWLKSCSWAILTNFETLAVYNADWRDSNFKNNQYFVLHPDDFLKDDFFTKLSKDSFKINELDSLATRVGKKQSKNPIDKQLLSDMIHFREILSKNIILNNSNLALTQEQLDDSVQRILDRLIFIRSAEDRTFEENKLQAVVRQWKSRGKGSLSQEINRIYSEYDSTYNSKLFAPDLCDRLVIDNEVLQETVDGLNESKDQLFRYDFSVIESDVLGNIYEQYLGNILKTTPKRAKLSESRIHRKEQGIYYTPSYVVDYIVKSAVGRYLATNSSDMIADLKILDPACGSGSFLIKAYQELENYWSNIKIGKKGKSLTQTKFDLESDGQFYNKKTEILKDNIFGVDLDAKAVEISRLNLLLRISEKKQRLPLLQSNIKLGNSLVNDRTLDIRGFNWQNEFPTILEKGGFDVVIGNPPYIDSEEMTKSQPELRTYFVNDFSVARGNWDIFCLFIERGLGLLKENGILSMIVPNKILSAEYAASLRNLISKYKIISIRDYSTVPVFEASVYPIVITIQKSNPKRNKIIVEKMKPLGGTAEIQSSLLFDQNRLNNSIANTWSHIFESPGVSIIETITKDSSRLGDIASVLGSATVSEAYTLKDFLIEGHGKSQEDRFVKFINTGTIDRFRSLWGISRTRYIKSNFEQPIIDLSTLKKILPKRFDQAVTAKIIVGGMNKRLECYLDLGSYLAGKSTSIVTSKPEELYFLIAVLNSKLMSYYYKRVYSALSLSGGYMRVGPPQLEKLPIKHISSTLKERIVSTVKDILKLNSERDVENKRISIETDQIESQLSYLDAKLDTLIYDAYGLSTDQREQIDNEFIDTGNNN